MSGSLYFLRWDEISTTIMWANDCVLPDTCSWSWSRYCHVYHPHTVCHASASGKPQSAEKILFKQTFDRATSHLSELSGITPMVWVQIFGEWEVSRLDLRLVCRGWETKPGMVPAWVKAPPWLEGLGTFCWGNCHMFMEVMQVCALLGAMYLPRL